LARARIAKLHPSSAVTSPVRQKLGQLEVSTIAVKLVKLPPNLELSFQIFILRLDKE